MGRVARTIVRFAVLLATGRSVREQPEQEAHQGAASTSRAVGPERDITMRTFHSGRSTRMPLKPRILSGVEAAKRRSLCVKHAVAL